MNRTANAMSKGEATSVDAFVPVKADSALSTVVAIGIYLTFLAGDTTVAGVEMRWLGVACMALAAFLLAPINARGGGNASIFWMFLWAVGLFLSMSWSPMGARLGEASADLTALVLMVILASFILPRLHPSALRRMWWTIWFSSVIFAGAALAQQSFGDQGRLAAFGGGPNVFVRVVSLGIFAAVYLTFTRGRWWTLLPAPILAGAALLSGSRGGVLALTVSLLILLALLLRGRSRRARAWTMIGIAVAGIAFWRLVWPRVSGYVQTRFGQETLNEGYASGRDVIAKDTWQLWLDNPLFGGGFDSYWVTFGQNYGYQHPHNFLLGSLGEAGILVTTPLIIALLLGFRSGWAYGSVHLCLGAICGVFLFVAGMFSGSWFDTRLMWLFLLLGQACIRAESAGDLVPRAPSNT